jgi:hypothetical protein
MERDKKFIQRSLAKTSNNTQSAIKKLKNLMNIEARMLRQNEVCILNFTEEETIAAKIPCKGFQAPCKITFEYYEDSGDLSIFTSNRYQNPSE